MSALAASIRNKKTAGSSGGVKSEVGVLEAIEYFEVLQVASPFFGNVFADAESVKALAMNMLIARFGAGQTIVEKGERGSWFGILLTGDVGVELPSGVEVVLSPGTLIGEMTLWTAGSVRSATIKGKAPGGLIATMLVDELPSFCEKQPGVGAKLMTLMGRSAIQKQVDNMRRALRTAHAPTLQLRDHDEAAAATFKEVLEANAFTSDEADLVCASCEYGAFKEGEVLAKPGSPWPQLVAFILSGTLTMAPWNLELTAGGCVGGLDFFGETLFGESASVVGHTDGTLAAISFAKLNELLRKESGADDSAASSLDQQLADGLLVDRLLKFIGGYSMQICEAAAASRVAPNEASPSQAPPKRTSIVRKASFMTDEPLAPAAAAEQSAFYQEKLREQSSSFLSQVDGERDEVEAALANKDQSLQHYKVLHAGVAGKLEKTQGLLQEAREDLADKEEQARELKRRERRSFKAIDLTTSSLRVLLAKLGRFVEGSGMKGSGLEVDAELAALMGEASKLTDAEGALEAAKQDAGTDEEEDDAPSPLQAKSKARPPPGGWSSDVRRQFGDRSLGKPPPPPPPAAAGGQPPETLAKVQEKQKENERILQKANQQKEAAMRLLEAAQKERSMILEESRKIEKANQILEQANADLLASQEAFERRKLMPTDCVEMSSQTDDRHVSSGTQTDSLLLEPLVAQGALALAAERALDVEGALQTHGAAWLGAASEAVHAEGRALLTLLSSKVQVPLPQQARQGSPPFPPAKLDHTWRHALKEEVLRALAPLKELIATFQQQQQMQMQQQQMHQPLPYEQQQQASQGVPPPVAIPPLPRRPPDDAAAALPAWLINPNEAVKFGQSPRSGRHLYFPAGAQSPRPGEGGGAPTSHPNDALQLPSMPVMTSRTAARALVFSKVDKQIAREVYEMRQLMRKQQELLPGLMHHMVE